MSAAAGAKAVKFTSSTTNTVGAFTRDAGTNVITLDTVSGAGTFTLAKSGGGTVGGLDYLSVTRSTATPGSTWYAGTHSTDGGANSGWIFGGAPQATTGTPASASWATPAASAYGFSQVVGSPASSSWSAPAGTAARVEVLTDGSCIHLSLASPSCEMSITSPVVTLTLEEC